MRITIFLFSALLLVDSSTGQTLPRWNFQEERELKYRLEQTALNTAFDTRMEMNAEADIVLRAAEGRAQTSLDMRMVSAKINDEEMPDEQLAAQRQAFRTTLREDGRLEAGRYPPPGNVQLLMDLMFPLPEMPLDLEQPVSQPMIMHAVGIPDLEGEAVFTHQGREERDDRTFLKYRVQIDLSTPEDADVAVGTGSLKAEVECLFDEEHNRFFRVTSNIDMEITAPPLTPDDQPSTMSQRSVITVQLQD